MTMIKVAKCVENIILALFDSVSLKEAPSVVREANHRQSLQNFIVLRIHLELAFMYHIITNSDVPNS